MRELAAGIKERNGVYWFKFTCCDTRQDVEPPDTIHKRAVCEKCGKEYNFEKRGGGIRAAFMVPRRHQPPNVLGY